MNVPPNEVTRLLQDVNQGVEGAQERLIPVVYVELRKLADSYMGRERDGHTLEPTALVHEAFIKLVDQRRVHWNSRGHFFGIAAQAMRRILVDYARRRKAERRGGGRQVTMITNLPQTLTEPLDLLSVDQALTELAEFDARAARVVELRFFGGLTVEEVAELLNVSEVTIKRDWRSAKAWLYRRLETLTSARRGHDQ